MSISAIAVFQKNIDGYIKFKEVGNKVKIEVCVSGLKPGLHGFHVHESGNLLKECKECKDHFNPYNKNHGGPNMKERHVGDLGNIEVDKNGKSNMVFYDHLIKLRGRICNIIGRSVIIHADEDNLGIPGDKESLTTGKAGKRLDCAVIGYDERTYFN